MKHSQTTIARFQRHFRDIKFTDKTLMLDVGGGKCEMANYITNTFKNKVVVVDPNTKCGIVEKFEDYKTDLKFDIIYLCHSLHHIIQVKEKIGQEYDFIAKKIFDLLKDNGQVVIYECQPIAKDNPIYESVITHVDLTTKHMPEEWIEFLKRGGFTEFKTEMGRNNYSYLIYIKK